MWEYVPSHCSIFFCFTGKFVDARGWFFIQYNIRSTDEFGTECYFLFFCILFITTDFCFLHVVGVIFMMFLLHSASQHVTSTTEPSGWQKWARNTWGSSSRSFIYRNRIWSRRLLLYMPLYVRQHEIFLYINKNLHLIFMRQSCFADSYREFWSYLSSTMQVPIIGATSRRSIGCTGCQGKSACSIHNFLISLSLRNNTQIYICVYVYLYRANNSDRWRKKGKKYVLGEIYMHTAHHVCIYKNQ